MKTPAQKKNIPTHTNPSTLTKARPAVQRKENRTGLPDNLKAGIENLSGYSMNDVKVHYNSSKPAGLQAHAYAQGTDIHLAPGQERHLPHEAWHVVQQKQGRVKPTKQLKEKTPVNDDKGLEHEADRMGNRAVGFAAQTPAALIPKETNAPGNTVQAYSIRQEGETGMLYSVSDDRSMITGMNTPNHELFVDHTDKIEQMTAAVSSGMVRFAKNGTQTLFGQNYYRVKPVFPKMRTKKEDSNFFEYHVNLDKTYHGLVHPIVKKDTEERRDALRQNISQLPWADRLGQLQLFMGILTKRVDLFKKLMLTHETFRDVPDEQTMQDTLGFIITLEKGIYSHQATGDGMGLLLEELRERAKDISEGPLKVDEHIMGTLDGILNAFENLLSVFPVGNDMPLDLVMVHTANYLENMLQSMDEGDPMFYRACDVMSSMLTGNRVDETNMDQQKLFDTEMNRNMHYVTKVLASHGDWVSLETFAAGTGYENEMMQTHPKRTSKLDHTWQYLMYGSLQREGSRLSSEDQFFELYTRMRYKQRGMDTHGTFSNRFKARFTSVLKDSEIKEFPEVGSYEKVPEVKNLLIQAGFIDRFGEVLVNETDLSTEALEAVLGEEYKVLAPRLSVLMILKMHTPSDTTRAIQDNGHNQLNTIETWLGALGLKNMPDRQYSQLDVLSTQGSEGAKDAFNKTIRFLLLSLGKGKKYKE